MKKYRQLKDLPWTAKGAIIGVGEDCLKRVFVQESGIPHEVTQVFYQHEIIQAFYKDAHEYPEWFELINEDPLTERVNKLEKKLQKLSRLVANNILSRDNDASRIHQNSALKNTDIVMAAEDKR
jgi:hypothetical protein